MKMKFSYKNNYKINQKNVGDLEHIFSLAIFLFLKEFRENA